MATTLPNTGAIIPAMTEPADQAVNNAAFTAIDTAIGAHLAEYVTDSNGAHGLKAETGLFTPILYGVTTAGTPTYAVQQGSYYRLGNLVHAYIRIDLTSKGGMTGALRIGGLPFGASSAYVSQGVLPGHLVGLTYGTNKIPIFTAGGQNYLSGIWLNDGNIALLDTSSLSDTFNIRLVFVYRA